MDINKIKKRGKTGLADALVEIEKNPFDKKSLSLLTQAYKSKNGNILGITGPPGVGKSSLIKNLIKYYRNKKTGRYSYPNNGQVSYTEKQFKEEFGHASNTYLSARDRLIKNGLIKQTYRGGMCRGDMATYKVLITPDLRESELRWLRYPKQNWEKEIPKNKNTLVGVKTRFKSKPTLINSTLNGDIHP